METVSTKVSEDLKETLEEYADSRKASKSEAMRDVLKAGLRNTSRKGRLRYVEHISARFSLIVGGFLLFLFPAMLATENAVIDVLAWSAGAYAVFFPLIYLITRYVRRDRESTAPDIQDVWKA